jgi:hypothetical protein
MGKYTMNLTDKQEHLLDDLREPLGVTTRAEVIRKGLSLAKLYADIRAQGHELVVMDAQGKPLERIRVL